jgi:iron complex transport system substrate-binding protein
MKRKSAVVIAVLSLLFGVIGADRGVCSAAETIIVTDIASRMVKVPLHPKRIICLGPGCLRLICYLGVEHRAVGIEAFEKANATGRSYRYAKPSLLKLPVIARGGPAAINKEPDLEAVLGLKPDVVFITYMEPAKADSLQKKLGIPVILLSYGRLGIFDKDLYESLGLVGRILQAEKRAADILSFVDLSKRDLDARVRPYNNTKKPTVYVGAIGYRGSYGIESTEADYAPLEWVKGNNVVKQVNESGHIFMNKEKILALDPEVIFIDGGGIRFMEAEYEKKPEFYRGLRAFRENRVCILWPFNMYATNIETVVADAYAVGKVLYPMVFDDIDPKKKADEVYSFFVGQSVRDQMVKDFGELASTWKKQR